LIVAAEDCKGASLAPIISGLIDSSQSHSLRQSRPSYRKSVFHFPKTAQFAAILVESLKKCRFVRIVRNKWLSVLLLAAFPGRQEVNNRKT
jgi:hypothetical protein